MTPQTPEKEVPTKGYSATPPAVLDAATVDEASLAAAAEAYHRDGFFIARGLFSREEVDDINALFHKMHADGGVPGFYEPGKLSPAEMKSALHQKDPDPLVVWTRVMHPHRFNEKARAYMLHPKVRVYLERFMGGEPVATQSMYFFKAPGSRGQAMHQDNFYLLVEPGTCMAAWTACDDCDVENGGLMVVPNSQNNELVCPGVADNTVSMAPHRVPIPKGQRVVAAEMKAGDTLFFNGNVIHGSGPNRSKKRFRRSFICHYAKGNLARISKYYTPVVSMDSRDLTTEANTSGGPCGGTWEGAAGA